MDVTGELLGASLDRPGAHGAAGDPLPHARQHLHQRHSALAQVGPGQRAAGMTRTTPSYHTYRVTIHVVPSPR